MNGEENKNRSGAPRVPPPPPPPIAIRTMESDLKSIQQSGGSQPTPIELAPPRPEPTKPEPDEIKITIPGYSGPEESVFKPEAVIPELPTGKPINTKVIAGAAVVVLALAATGFAAYYFVLPALFPPAPKAPAEVAPPPAPPAPESTPTFVHKSYLIQPANLTVEVKLEPLSATNYRKALAEAAADNRPPKTLKEIVFVGTDGIFSFAELAGALFPNLKTAALFENDYTFLLYYDEKGVWPILVAKRAGTGAETEIKKLETSPNLENIFINEPGDIAEEGFKDGSAGGFASVRYALFSGGAALNYGWFNNYLVVSASYAGFRETAARLIAK